MHFLRSLSALTVLLTLAAAAVVPSHARAGDIVKDSYIVVLKESATLEQETAFAAAEAASSRRSDGTVYAGVDQKYEFGSLKAYTGKFDKSSIEQIASRPDVAYVEPDKVVVASAMTSQVGAPWGLGRISNKAKGSTTYHYDTSSGAGTTAYVIDTGVLITHKEFGGRAIWGINAVLGSPDTDENGHGTHVAGTIAGTTFGVAKAANIVAVKVLDRDGKGTTTGVISGIQWAVTNALGKKAVANMSLGGVFSPTMNSFVAAAIIAGLPFVVSAGNSNGDASGFSPASEPSAITVGASDREDFRSVFSNFGRVVDIFAPGTDILSAYIGSDTATRTISGTSMAAPHVAGMIAYLMGMGSNSTTAAPARMIELAQKNVLTGVSNSPNVLLYNGSGL